MGEQGLTKAAKLHVCGLFVVEVNVGQYVTPGVYTDCPGSTEGCWYEIGTSTMAP